MKKVITTVALLITTLACNFFSRLPSASPSPTDNAQPTQVVSQNIQDVKSSVSKWDLSITNTAPAYKLTGVYDPSSQQYQAIWRQSLFSGTGISISDENSTAFTYQSYFVDNKVVYFSNENQQPTAVDLMSGNKTWQSDIQATILGLGKSTVLAYREDNRIYGLDKNTGQEKWKIIVPSLVPENQALQPFPYIVPNQNDITVPMLSLCGNGFNEWNIRYLHIDEMSGDAKLTDCDITPDIDTPYTFASGLVIAQDVSSQYGSNCLQGSKGIAGINPTNGIETWIVHAPDYGCLDIWETDTQNNLMYIERPEANGSFSETSTDLVAIDTKTGSNVWGDGLLAKNGVLGTEPFSGKFAVTKKYIYFVSSSNEILVFQKDNGNLINKFSQERTFNAFFSDNGGLVISYPELGTSKGIDPASSQEIWKNDDLVLTDSLTTIGDIVIFEDKDTKEVFGLNQKTGEVSWKKVIEGYPDSAVTFYTNHFAQYGNVILYKDAQNSRVYLLDPASGDNRVIIDMPLDTRTIRPLQNNLWLVEFSGQLSLVSLK